MVRHMTRVVTNGSQSSQSSQTSKPSLGNLIGKETFEDQCGNQDRHEDHRDHKQKFLPDDKSDQEGGKMAHSEDNSGGRCPESSQDSTFSFGFLDNACARRDRACNIKKMIFRRIFYKTVLYLPALAAGAKKGDNELL